MKYSLVADFGFCKTRFECDCEIKLMLAIDFFSERLSSAKEIYVYEYDEDDHIVSFKQILMKED